MRDATEPTTPTLRQVVLDCEDARALAEFYRQLLGYQYRPGDEPPADGMPRYQRVGAGIPAGAFSAPADLA
jgi:Glyoxalase-like domain